ncbi:MAG: circularly permuted type 2 ATP-grasp protein, partial [Gemmatimonadota bacterium]
MVHSDGGAPAPHLPTGLLGDYKPLPGTFDEAFEPDGKVRPSIQAVIDSIDGLPHDEFRKRKEIAEETFLRHGVTFAVYSDEASGVERVFPFDLIPRVISAEAWETMDAGLRQRIEALEAFLADVYGDGRCMDDGVIPREIVEKSSGYLPEMKGIVPPGGVRVHIAGIDIIQDPDGSFLVLEDNLRTPSGVSYVLENRAIMKRTFPRIFEEANVRPVDDYPLRLAEALSSLAPGGKDDPRVVILTPGSYNSAYFEHSFLARRTGCELVEGSDLFVANERVWVKTTLGAQPVDVIYRRIDDEFMDPEVFRKDS